MVSHTAIAALALAPGLLVAQDLFTGVDKAYAEFSYSAGMDFDNGPGELKVSRFEAKSFLGQPIKLGGDWQLATALRYRATFLESDGAAPNFLLDDETLHNIALQGFLIRASDSTPWIYGLWAQAAISTDFQNVDSDDFLFDVGAGVGYRFANNFTLIAGAVVTELNGDEQILPGLGFDWKVNDCIHVGLLGPNFTASYHPSDDWIFSLKTESGGGVWNVERVPGGSERLEFRSLLVGLHAERRLTESLWLGIGAGVSVGNKLEYGSPDGLTTFKDHPDDGWFAQVGLRVASW